MIWLTSDKTATVTVHLEANESWRYRTADVLLADGTARRQRGGHDQNSRVTPGLILAPELGVAAAAAQRGTWGKVQLQLIAALLTPIIAST